MSDCFGNGYCSRCLRECGWYCSACDRGKDPKEHWSKLSKVARRLLVNMLHLNPKDFGL